MTANAWDHGGQSDLERDGGETGPGGQPSLTWFAAIALRERRLLVAAAAIGIIGGVAMSLTSPATYSVSFSFVPQGSQDGGRSGLASLAGQFGVALGGLGGQGQSPQFYADLVETRELLLPIPKQSVRLSAAERTPTPVSKLLEVRGTDERQVLENTVKALRSLVVEPSVAPRATGVVAVTVKTTSANASLEIAESLLEGVNQFNVSTRRSQASAERKFVETRLDASRASLRVAEEALQRFLQSNRQILNSPELSLQRSRLEREIAQQQQLVTTLVQQFEDAKIREVRDTPVITVIERPALPGQPDPRGRLKTIAAGFSIALLLALSFILARESIRQGRRDDPAASLLATEWARLRGRAGV